MSEIQEITDKLTRWLKEDGLKFEDVIDDNLLNILVYANDQFSLNVLIRTAKSQNIEIITYASFTEDDKRAYMYLQPDAKKEFMANLEILLIQINVLYKIGPEPPQKIDSIELSKKIYFDGLSRNSFFDGILAILRGLQVVKLNYGSLVPSSSQPSIMQ